MIGVKKKKLADVFQCNPVTADADCRGQPLAAYEAAQDEGGSDVACQSVY